MQIIYIKATNHRKFNHRRRSVIRHPFANMRRFIAVLLLLLRAIFSQVNTFTHIYALTPCKIALPTYLHVLATKRNTLGLLVQRKKNFLLFFPLRIQIFDYVNTYHSESIRTKFNNAKLKNLAEKLIENQYFFNVCTNFRIFYFNKFFFHN